MVCLVCGESDSNYLKPVLLKAPKAYRTNLSQGNDSKEDSLILLSRPPIFAESNKEDDNKTETDKISNTNISITDRDVTWRVNTNADNFFKGRLYNVVNKFRIALDDFEITKIFSNRKVVKIERIATKPKKALYVPEASGP